MRVAHREVSAELANVGGDGEFRGGVVGFVDAIAADDRYAEGEQIIIEDLDIQMRIGGDGDAVSRCRERVAEDDIEKLVALILVYRLEW